MKRGKPVSPKSARINTALQRLGGDANPVLIKKHAGLIHGAMLDLIVAYRARGFEIGRGDDGGFYAQPKTSTAGPARELTELAAKCRKAVAGKISREDWTTLWAAQPERIKRLWKLTLIKTRAGRRRINRRTIAAGFEAEGYVMVAPRPEIVLPAIEAALVKIRAAPNTKKRERDADEADAVAAIRNAYVAITGNKGSRVVARGRLAGRLHALRREFDGIFGTALSDVKDGKRFR